MKITLTSKYRWRATADQRRQYGGGAVTEFWVELDGKLQKWTMIGYGPTPGDRKTFAKRAVERKLAEMGA